MRKWMIPDASLLEHVAYFSKDLFFILVLACPPHSSTAAIEIRKMWFGLGIVLVFVGGIVSSCSGVNWVGAAMTVRATVILPLVAYCASKRLGTASLSRYAILVALLTLSNATLGAVQYNLPRNHTLNVYSQHEAAVAAFGDSVRATGTFSYISGMGVIAMLGTTSGLILLGSRLREWSSVVLGVVSVCAAMVCALTSISRLPAALNLGMTAAWLAYVGLAEKSLSRWLATALVASGFVVFLASSSLQPLFITILERHADASGSETLSGRLLGPFVRITDATGMSGLGQGLGGEQVAGVYAASGHFAYANFEDPWPRLVLELGVLGALGFLVIASTVLVSLWAQSKSACCRQQHSAAFAVFMLASCIFTVNASHNHVASGFLWPLIAVTLGTRRCDRCAHKEYFHSQLTAD